jgi:hypothetical protein
MFSIKTASKKSIVSIELFCTSVFRKFCVDIFFSVMEVSIDFLKHDRRGIHKVVYDGMI